MEKIKGLFDILRAYIVVGLIFGSPLLFIVSLIFFTKQTIIFLFFVLLYFGFKGENEMPSPPANDYERGMRDGYANGHDDGYWEGVMDEWKIGK